MSSLLLVAPDGNQVSCLIKALSDLLYILSCDCRPLWFAVQSITCSPQKEYLVYHHLVQRLMINPTFGYSSLLDTGEHVHRAVGL